MSPCSLAWYILRFSVKGPLVFHVSHTCLESWLGLVFFSTAYVTFAVALLFGGLVLLLAFLQSFVNRFLSLRCSIVTLLERGALACFYECMDSVSDLAGVLAFSSRAKHMLQILVVV